MLAKLANHPGMDPSMMAPGGPQGAGGPPPMPPQGGGAGGPPPMPPQGGDPSMGAGGPPPDMGGGMGIPPELEQLISQLPPEVLAQLVAEIQGELGNGGDPSQGGGDPSQGDPNAGAGAGGPPPPQDLAKAGSAKHNIEDPDYMAGFVERSLCYGFDKEASKDIYKRTWAFVTGKQPARQKQAAAQDNSHYEGFMAQAKTAGVDLSQAHAFYLSKYSN